MAFTTEIVDFNGLDFKSVQKKLSDLNIPLTPDEAIRIQNDMLGRAPSLAELILFSIQGSEHCSYKSSRNHLKKFVTDGPDVILGALTTTLHNLFHMKAQRRAWEEMFAM